MTQAGLPLRERFDRYVSPEPNTGCFLWTGALDPHGYGALTVKGVTAKAHRLAYEFECDIADPTLSVLHKCDVRCCVNPDHLFLGTRAENLADMRSKGRHYTKLSSAQVIAISADPRSHRAIAREYGVVKSTIGNIKRGTARLDCFAQGKP